MVENSRTDPELSCPGASIAVGSDLLRNSTQQRTAAAGDLKSSVFFSGIKKTTMDPDELVNHNWETGDSIHSHLDLSPT